MLGPGVVVASGRHATDRRTVTPATYMHEEAAPVRIEDGAWVGANSTILAGVVVRRGAVVGANSVVVSDVEEYGLVAGAPAKALGKGRSTLGAETTTEWGGDAEQH